MGNVSPPTGGLKGNSNYFLYAGGAALKNVSVAIDVTTDIVGNIGFSFQLNAYSPAGASTEDGWQQYIIQLQTGDGFPGSTTPSTLYGQIEPWPQSTSGFSPTTGSDLINDYITLQSLPNSSTILKGYKLTISLENDGSTGNVRYVTFVVVDNLGNTQYNHKTDIVGLKLDTTGKKATTSDLSPIIAFELNFVGPTSGEQSYLWSGAGTITYTADNTMTVVSALPSPDPADTNWVTVEDANSTYGKLPDTPSKSFTQTFSTVDPPAFTPGGPIAVSRQFGDNVTDVFAIDRGGLLVVFYVSGSGHWKSTTGFGPEGFARRNAALAACQQFGAVNQTDIFVVAQNGQLNVFWIAGSTGVVSGPLAIGPTGLANSGAALAVSQQFGATNQTDVFLIDGKGQLNVFWVNAAGPWNGPEKIGAKGFVPANGNLAACRQFGATDQTDVFVVDNSGQLNVFWVNDAGAWNGPLAIGPKAFAPAGAALAASERFGTSNQTDVFVVDNSGQLNVFWVDAAGAWNGPQAIGPTGFAPPGAPLAVSQQFGATNQTDVFVVDNSGQLNVFWVQKTGTWNGPLAIGAKGVAAAGAMLAASQQFGATNQTDVFLLNQTGTNAPGWPVVFWVGGAGAWNGPKALVAEA
jgi:hypothetical protein